MEIPGNKKLIRIILIWFLINTVLGIIITLIVCMNSHDPLQEIFIRTEISTHVISYLSVSAGYFSGRKFRHRAFLPGLILTLICVYPATLSGMVISMIINYRITGTVESHFINTMFMSLILATVITSITTAIERLLIQRTELETELDKVIKGSLLSDKKSPAILTVKEKENYHAIKMENILYMSAHGKKTVIHTEEKDYETSQLIKDIEARLDHDLFIRIHRQYIINLKYISHIKHHTGSTYLACLNDEDENNIPVGRTYISLLKEKMNIKK